MSTVDIHDLAQTWNNGAVDFTAIKMNVTDTASSATSKLLDLQVGGSSRFNVRKDGYVTIANGLQLSGGTVQVQGTSILSNAIRMGGSVQVLSREVIETLTGPVLGNTDNVLRLRVSSNPTFHLTANTIEQRNSTNPQAFNLYNTYTDASNYERLRFGWTSNVFEIKPENAGTGSARVIHISGLPTSNPGPGILWNNAGTPAIGT